MAAWVSRDALAQMLLTAFVLLCFPLWMPIAFVLVCVLVPLLVVDELAQRCYEEHVVSWKVTARAEEALWVSILLKNLSIMQ